MVCATQLLDDASVHIQHQRACDAVQQKALPQSNDTVQQKALPQSTDTVCDICQKSVDEGLLEQRRFRQRHTTLSEYHEVWECEWSPHGDRILAAEQRPFLQRYATLTEYNEVWECEWRPHGDRILAAFPPASYLVVPEPSSCIPVVPASLPDVEQAAFVAIDVGSTGGESDSSASTFRKPEASVPVVATKDVKKSFKRVVACRKRQVKMQAEKEVRKLQKKLHAIAKLQERTDLGEKLDKLQLEKVQKRHELEKEIAAVQKAADEEVAEIERWVIECRT